jgi:hypothetical protein
MRQRHWVLAVLPSSEFVFSGQGLQAGLAKSLAYFPGGQGRHASESTSYLKVPGAQGAHWASVSLTISVM